MKKLAPILLSLTLAGSLSLPALAASTTTNPPAGSSAPSSGYTLQVNGTETGLEGCMMVPLRALAEHLGFTVTWNGSSIRVDSGRVHTDVTPGVDRYVITTSLDGMVGMSAPFSLGCPPCVSNGITYVPLALFDALLGNEDAITGDSGTISIQTTPSSQIPNPFVSCTTLAEAEEQAGFSLTLPADCHISSLSVVPHTMIQANRADGLTIRKAVGNEDISEDYHPYSHSETVSVSGKSITLKGEGQLVMVALWTADDYTYAIQSETGLSRDAMLALAAEVA